MYFFLNIFLLFFVKGFSEILEVGEGKSFEKIQDAVDYSSEGDIIRIFPGTYFENIQISSYMGSRTLEGADPDNPPTITGEDLSFSESDHSWEHVEAKIYKTHYKFPLHHLTPEEFTSCASGYLGSQSEILTVYEDDTWLRGYQGLTCDYLSFPYSQPSDLYHMNDYPRYSGSTRNIFIPGRFYYDENAEELYVWSAKEDNPSNHVYHIPIMKYLLQIRGGNTTVRNIVFKHAYYYPIYISWNGHNTVIEDCFIINNGPHGIKNSECQNTTIRRNVIKVNGFYERQDYISVRKTRLKQVLLSFYGFQETKGLKIYENIISGTYGITALSQDAQIYNNIISHAQSVVLNPSIDSSAPEEGYRQNIKIFNNIIHHGDYSALTTYNNLDPDDTKYYGNIYFFRNLVYNVKWVNKEGCLKVACDPTPGYFIYHNTFVNLVGIAHHPYLYPVHKRTVYNNNMYFLRHVDYLHEGNKSDIWYYSSKSEDEGWQYFPFSVGPESDYNLVYRKVDDEERIGIFVVYNNTLGKSVIVTYEDGEFAQMNKDLGIDQNSIYASPQFENEDYFSNIKQIEEFNYDTITNRDYRTLFGDGVFIKEFYKNFEEIKSYFKLKSTSPAINKGKKLTNLPDIIQTDSTPDIGCFESSKSNFFLETYQWIIIISISAGVLLSIIIVFLVIIFLIIFFCIKKVKNDADITEMNTF